MSNFNELHKQHARRISELAREAWQDVPGRVAAVNGTTIDVEVAGGTVPGLTFQAGANPAVGDFCWVRLRGSQVMRADVVASGSNSGSGAASSAGDTWHDLPMQSGWVNNTWGYYGAQYKRTDAGLLLRGMIKNGGFGTLAVLPAGYRPTAFMVRGAYTSGGGQAQMQLLPDGTLTIDTNPGGNWVSLDGVVFPLD